MAHDPSATELRDLHTELENLHDDLDDLKQRLTRFYTGSHNVIRSLAAVDTAIEDALGVLFSEVRTAEADGEE